MKIYLASSWRNQSQAEVLAGLRGAGHEVYDFKNPAPGNSSFSWKQIDPNYSKEAIPERGAVTRSAQWMRTTLAHSVAQAGFDHDFNAMKWADVCVLLLPCGLSAHLEAGWFAGAGKQVAVLAPEIREPELMYKLFDVDSGFLRLGRVTPILESMPELLMFLAGYALGRHDPETR